MKHRLCTKIKDWSASVSLANVAESDVKKFNYLIRIE